MRAVYPRANSRRSAAILSTASAALVALAAASARERLLHRLAREHAERAWHAGVQLHSHQAPRRLRADEVVVVGLAADHGPQAGDAREAAAARGVMSVQLDTGVPCAFGVLTCETMEQALARSGGGVRDQGRRAAEAVLAMAALRRELHGG